MLRLFALWSLALWIGGFTFYSVVVIPVLHDQLGSVTETGLITQRVTDHLNLISLVAIALGWCRAMIDRPRAEIRRTRWDWSVLFLSVGTVCLGALVFLHRELDSRLGSGEMNGFYALHRIYLWCSTIQWLASLFLLSLWAQCNGRSRLDGSPENPQVS